jgi:hypothetical protein
MEQLRRELQHCCYRLLLLLLRGEQHSARWAAWQFDEDLRGSLFRLAPFELQIALGSSFARPALIFTKSLTSTDLAGFPMLLIAFHCINLFGMKGEIAFFQMSIDNDLHSVGWSSGPAWNKGQLALSSEIVGRCKIIFNLTPRSSSAPNVQRTWTTVVHYVSDPRLS